MSVAILVFDSVTKLPSEAAGAVVIVFGVSGLALLAVGWELYKAVGPETGGTILGWRVLPRTEDAAMPHVWDMLAAYTKPELRGDLDAITLKALAIDPELRYASAD